MTSQQIHTQHFSSLWTSGFFYQLQACSQMIITLPSTETYIWNHPLHVFYILCDYLEWNHSTWVLCILQFACVDTSFDRVLQFWADKVNWYNTDWNRYLQLMTLVIYEIGYGFHFKSRQNLFSKDPRVSPSGPLQKNGDCLEFLLGGQNLWFDIA